MSPAKSPRAIGTWSALAGTLLLALAGIGGTEARGQGGAAPQAPFVALAIAPDSTELPKRYTAGSQLSVGVVATDTDGYVKQVGLSLLRLDIAVDEDGNESVDRTLVRSWAFTSPPFVANVQLPSHSGRDTRYELHAEVTDDDDLVTESTEGILVFNAGRPLPRVEFAAPTNGSQYTFGSAVDVAFNVESFGQELDGVAVYENERQIALLTEAPYGFSYTPLRSGPRSLVVIPYFSVQYEEGTGQSRIVYQVYTAAQTSVSFSVSDFNPLTSDEDFVSQTFLDVFGRSASPADLALWLPRLNDTSLGRAELVAAVVDHPNYAEVEATLAANLVVVGGWPGYAEFAAQLVTTRGEGMTALAANLLASSAYRARYGPPPTLASLATYANQEALAKRLYQNAFGRSPTLIEIQAVANAPGSLTQAAGYNVVGLESFLAEFVAKNGATLRAQARAAGVRLGLTRTPPGNAQVVADASLGVEALAEVLLNSTRYTGRFLFVTQSPRSLHLAAGSGGLLEVVAEGGSDVTYQWYHAGRLLPGAISPILALEEVLVSDRGAYYAVVRSSTGAVASGSAVVDVTADGTSRLANISTRAQIGTGGEALIAGFAIAGPDEATILARVVGPTLAELGVDRAAADPRLTVVRSGAAIASSDDWGTGAPTEARDAAAATGAFALLETSTDAATVVGLSAGNATVVGANTGDIGEVGLVEVYEVGTAEAKIVNLSSRGLVGTGERVMIGGLVVGGNVSRRLLVRAIGPSLLPHGVTNVLANPRLEVLQGETVLAANDDWTAGPDPQLVAALSERAGAFPLPPGSLDAALVLSVEPGSYTVIVRGADATPGVALVEVYDLDP